MGYTDEFTVFTGFKGAKLRMLILLGLLISGFVFFSGCVQEKALTVSNDTPTVQPTTSTEIYCVSNETGKKMSLFRSQRNS
jgi:hypothetical protein